MDNLSKEQHDELCTAYASMILFDGEAEITSDSIQQIIKASNNEVEPYWPMLFAGVLSQEGKVLELISSGGAGVGGSSAASGGEGAADTADADAAAAAEKAEKEKEEEEEAVSTTVDMIF